MQSKSGLVLLNENDLRGDFDKISKMGKVLTEREAFNEIKKEEWNGKE
ncbi:MAG: hypothetical protein RR854_00210 [Muribaculaceae bacterium]